MTQNSKIRSPRAGRNPKTGRGQKPLKAQPILLDRLAHALDAHGVSLKRTEVLAVAAAAFGYHNANAFSAADLAVPTAVLAGETVLADGTSLLIVTDPIAKASYGVDESFMDVIAETRRERFGVSPYGHLLDLSTLSNSVPASLKKADITPGTKIYVAVVDHKHGSTTHVALSHTELQAEIASYCREYWTDASRSAGAIEDHADDEALIAAYFEDNDREGITYGEGTLPALAASAPVAPKDPGGMATEIGHTIFLHSDWKAGFRQHAKLPGYAEWVKARAVAFSEENWVNSNAILLSKGETVILRIHGDANGTFYKPGTTAEIVNVVTLQGRIDVELRLDSGETLVFSNVQRFGYFPFSHQNRSANKNDPMHPVVDWSEAVAQRATALSYPDWVLNRTESNIAITESWLTLEEAGQLRSGEKFQIRIHGSGESYDEKLDANVEANYSPGTRVMYIDTVARDSGHAPLLVLESEDLEIILEPRGSFYPIARLTDATGDTAVDESDPYYKRADWKAAVAKRATAIDFDEWLSDRRTADAKSGWLTNVQAQSLKRGTRLVFRVHGTADCTDMADGSNGTTTFSVGESVTVSKVTLNGTFGPMTLAVITDDNVEILLSDQDRQGLYPLSLPHEGAGPSIGDVVNFEGQDCHISVADVGLIQPLAKDGLFVFVDQYGETKIAERDQSDNGWALFFEYNLTPSQQAAISDV